jgi:MoxR-like ATPase
MAEYEPTAALGEVQHFGEAARKVLNEVAYNEPDAVEASLVAMLTNGKLLLSGPPGGAKTNLAKGVISLFDDLDLPDLAIVPAESDLSPTRLVGGDMANTKTVTNEDGERKEETAIEIPGIIKPSTAVIFADEINRTNPMALNAALPVFAERTLVNTSGRHYMGRLVMSILTMNPNERRSGTFDLAGAMASRVSSGAIAGNPANKTEATRRDTITKITHNDEPDFSAITPVTSMAKLASMREQIKGVVVPSNDRVDDLIGTVVMDSIDALAKMGFYEGDGRFARQVVANARAIAALNAKPGVDEFAVREGAKLVVAGRLGALSHRAYQEIPELHSMIDAA